MLNSKSLRMAALVVKGAAPLTCRLSLLWRAPRGLRGLCRSRGAGPDGKRMPALLKTYPALVISIAT